MENKIIILKNNDVVSINAQGLKKAFFQHSTFKYSHILSKIKESLNHNISLDEKELLIGDGVDCEVLMSNDIGWKKGKLKLNLTFYLDIVENEDENKNKNKNEELPPTNDSEQNFQLSPLDDLRQQFNE
ncbi:KGK domain-containing protein [Calothrix sp. UHCC 0171]|uniref:KGK domain-containing protein n=1 Tax=Calothrix sp. UHCC 0171 TaxID=3110245 RepID=UPI002B21FFD0|nr:KGK domain-containing protein [Calothrix sp. UHCC 0171]MEA5569450.1 KGK domain-containing protein [Calothrix sp. UHCC 0171]